MASRWKCTICGELEYVTNGVCDECAKKTKQGVKVGDIELHTTPEEIEEIGSAFNKVSTSQTLSKLAVALTKTQFNSYGQDGITCGIVGIAIGAEIYRRRQAEAGNAMMLGFNETDAKELAAKESQEIAFKAWLDSYSQAYGAALEDDVPAMLRQCWIDAQKHLLTKG
jgi:hypothetical protein